jgi:hypothetical protein
MIYFRKYKYLTASPITQKPRLDNIINILNSVIIYAFIRRIYGTGTT